MNWFLITRGNSERRTESCEISCIVLFVHCTTLTDGHYKFLNIYSRMEHHWKKKEEFKVFSKDEFSITTKWSVIISDSGAQKLGLKFKEVNFQRDSKNINSDR